MDKETEREELFSDENLDSRRINRADKTGEREPEIEVITKKIQVRF